MRNPLFYILLAFLSLASCNDDAEQRKIENARDMKKKEAVFANIDKAWNFNTRPINPVSGSMNSKWTEWRVFLEELSHKPTSTIDAFRKKSKALSQKAKDLNNNIPPQFNKPEIRSRINVLITKINSLNLFINLNDIPDKKVTAIISDINTELVSLQMQMGEIVRKSQIPTEEGEADMIRMLDTTRAIPNVKKTENPK